MRSSKPVNVTTAGDTLVERPSRLDIAPRALGASGLLKSPRSATLGLDPRGLHQMCYGLTTSSRCHRPLQGSTLEVFIWLNQGQRDRQSVPWKWADGGEGEGRRGQKREPGPRNFAPPVPGACPLRNQRTPPSSCQQVEQRRLGDPRGLRRDTWKSECDLQSHAVSALRVCSSSTLKVRKQKEKKPSRPSRPMFLKPSRFGSRGSSLWKTLCLVCLSKASLTFRLERTPCKENPSRVLPRESLCQKAGEDLKSLPREQKTLHVGWGTTLPDRDHLQ